MKSKIAQADFKIDSIVSILKTLVDNGSTDSLHEKIETGTSGQTSELYQDLMTTSPYLSDTVLVVSAENESVFSNSLLKDILVANPQSAKSDEILTTLDNRNDPMPDSLYAEIMEGKDTISAKEFLESELAGWIQLRQTALNGMIFKYNNDSLITSGHDSIISALLQDYQIESKFDLIMYYLDHMQFSEANIILDNIPGWYDLSGEQSLLLQRYTSLSEIISQLHNDPIGYLNPDSVQIGILQTLAESDIDVPGSYARNILLQQHLTTYLEPLPEGGDYKSTRLTKKKGTKSKPSNQLIIYPNPCKDQFFIKNVNLVDKQEIVNGLFDATGKRLQLASLKSNNGILTVSMAGLNSGIYYFYLSINGKKGDLFKIIHYK